MSFESLKSVFSTRLLLVAAGLLALNQLLALAAPYLVKVAIDDGIAAGQSDVLWVVGIVGVLIYGGAALTKFGGSWLSTKAGEEAWESLRNRLFGHVQSLPLSEIRSRRVGGLVARVYSDTYQLKQLATSVLPAGINLLVGVGGAAVILLVLAPQLTLLALIPIPIGWMVLRWFRKYVRPLSKARMERHGALHSALHEGIAGVEDVKALRAEETIAERVFSSGRDLKETDLELAWHRIRLGPAADFGISLILLGTLVAGGHLAIQGTLSVGTVVVFYFYVGRCLGPIRGIPGMVYSWHSARAAMDRMQELLSITSQISDPQVAVEAAAGPLSVDFEGVEFSYGENRALDGFTLSAESGSRTAILGPSGVGKSTTARLLLRLMDGDAGTLRLQDVEIRDWSVDALRRRIGYVGQEAFLFDGTLRSNLVLGCKEAPSDQEIDKAIKAAGLEEVVGSGRGGLEMEVGERGGKLSGGQKKRVALARAMLRRPDLLIIDQMATDLEEAMNERIFRMLRAEGMTLVYFGHRVPAGLDPDEVYWMEAGQVREYEVGIYEELGAR